MHAPPPGDPEESSQGHVPVMIGAVEALLEPKLRPGATLLDATLGRGGHAAALLPRIAGGTLVGLDLDAGNLEHCRRRLAPLAVAHQVTLHLHHGSFADVRAVLDAPDLQAAAGAGGRGVDVLLADLGFASNQVDDPARGLSFRSDGPLDMRLNRDDPGRPTAAELVNTLPAEKLADLLYRHGEERLSRRIARRIVEAREQAELCSTTELAEIVRRAYPPPPRRGSGSPRHAIHPATRTFQALRIEVNGELLALDALLAALPGVLMPGAVAAVISFHSLEDRRVKRAFLGMQQQGLGERLTRRPLTAGVEEAVRNPRSRSAKLRGFQRS